jgi:uncharacterized protein
MGGLVVDRDARTIAGMAVPYGPVGRAGSRRWTFEPGALTPATVIWLLVDHDNSQRRGRVVELAETDHGLWTRSVVNRGTAGDRVLALAATGLYKGLSVGVDNPNTRREHGRTIVHRAVLVEVSLTDNPAFKGGEL